MTSSVNGQRELDELVAHLADGFSGGTSYAQPCVAARRAGSAARPEPRLAR